MGNSVFDNYSHLIAEVTKDGLFSVGEMECMVRYFPLSIMSGFPWFSSVLLYIFGSFCYISAEMRD